MSRLRAAVAMAGAIALVSGCGGDSSSGGSAVSDDGYVAEVQARVDQQYKGTFQSPPTTAPRAPRDYKVWVISCGEQVTYCAEGSKGLKEAGRSLGWDVDVFDTKGNPASLGDGVSQAVAAGADAVIPWLIDCSSARGQLQAAKRKGVTLLGIESLDCSETDESQEPLYDGAVEYAEGTFSEFIGAYGRQQADWIIAKTDGKAKTLVFENSESQGVKIQNAGLYEQLRACEGCEVVKVPFTYSELGNALQSKAEQALIKNPDANSVYANIDAIISSGVGPAIQSQNRGSMFVMGAEGLAPAPDLVRAGIQQDAGIGFVPKWEGYAAVDSLIRLANGEKVESSGIGLQTWDKDHNLPSEGGSFEAPIDFVAAYEKAWRVG